jgi:C1A family cysteine protease
MEYTPTPAMMSAAAKLHPSLKLYQKYIMADPGSIVLIPNVVDHRPNQTPVKDQNNRGTCVCFASLAGLEAKYGSTTLDLSEQYANYLYMTAEGRGCKSAGLKTTDSADYLKANGVCQESICPYQNDKYNFPSYCNNGGTPAPAMRTSAVGHDPYRIKSFEKIWRNESLTTDTGNWINNPRYLMSILASGQDIVFGTHVAGWVSPYTGIIDVTLTPGGDPVGSVGGHAMLVVGYNRSQEYFIVKNSWGTSRGQAGYVYLSFDYVRTYAKYGYIITEVEPLMMTMIRPMMRAVPRLIPSD